MFIQSSRTIFMKKHILIWIDISLIHELSFADYTQGTGYIVVFFTIMNTRNNFFRVLFICHSCCPTTLKIITNVTMLVNNWKKKLNERCSLYFESIPKYLYNKLISESVESFIRMDSNEYMLFERKKSWSLNMIFVFS